MSKISELREVGFVFFNKFRKARNPGEFCVVVHSFSVSPLDVIVCIRDDQAYIRPPEVCTHLGPICAVRIESNWVAGKLLIYFSIRWGSRGL